MKTIITTDELKILCPFCNAVYTAQMLDELEDIGSKCESCGPSTHIVGSMELKCSHCEKVFYKKEYDEYLD